MSDRARSLVGVIGSGQMGRDPFDRRSWSGISYYLFTELMRQGKLHRAFGVEVPAARRYLFMARNVRRDRAAWRSRFYMDTGYRDALTAEVRRRIKPEDLEHDFLQIGALYDVPFILEGRRACYSYHDGNLASSLRAPHTPKGLGARAIDRALAFERRVYGGIRTIFAMSEYLRQSFIRDFDVPEDRVVAIGAGINLDAVPEYRPDKDYGRQEILFIGVEFARKGGWPLLEAFRGVRGRFPEATLHLVGPRELAIPPHLEAGVVYHGHLSKADPAGQAKLGALFGRCGLFVMPSLYEPFGIAPLEAMVNQLPAVVTDGWALREMVRPGETGERVQCGSVEDLEAKLSALLADPDRLRRMGDAARQSVLNYYTWEAVVRRMIEAIEVRQEGSPA